MIVFAQASMRQIAVGDLSLFHPLADVAREVNSRRVQRVLPDDGRGLGSGQQVHPRSLDINMILFDCRSMADSWWGRMGREGGLPLWTATQVMDLRKKWRRVASA